MASPLWSSINVNHMTTLTRKQRELEQRETLILDVAKDMLLRDGYLGMTMDRIAESCEYSKGTIYNHFPNKEEIVAELGLRTMNLRTDLFARGSALKGLTRERMMGVGTGLELFVRLYPREFQALSIIQAASVREKTTAQRQQALRACDNRCMGIVAGIVRDAVSQSDLVLHDGITPEKLSFGLWSMNYGAYSLMGSDIPLQELGVDDPFEVAHKCSHMLLDGYGWQPLSTEWDFDKTEARIREEIFSDEFAQLEKLAA